MSAFDFWNGFFKVKKDGKNNKKNYKKNIIKNIGFYGKTLGDHGQKIYGTFGRLSDALSFAK